MQQFVVHHVPSLDPAASVRQQFQAAIRHAEVPRIAVAIKVGSSSSSFHFTFRTCLFPTASSTSMFYRRARTTSSSMTTSYCCTPDTRRTVARRGTRHCTTRGASEWHPERPSPEMCPSPSISSHERSPFHDIGHASTLCHSALHCHRDKSIWKLQRYDPLEPALDQSPAPVAPSPLLGSLGIGIRRRTCCLKPDPLQRCELYLSA